MYDMILQLAADTAGIATAMSAMSFVFTMV
jgi:hypothetical protein